MTWIRSLVDRVFMEIWCTIIFLRRAYYAICSGVISSTAMKRFAAKIQYLGYCVVVISNNGYK